jgi:hypothetical protein
MGNQGYTPMKKYATLGQLSLKTNPLGRVAMLRWRASSKPFHQVTGRRTFSLKVNLISSFSNVS